jgi:hypothetical protein
MPHDLTRRDFMLHSLALTGGLVLSGSVPVGAAPHLVRQGKELKLWYRGPAAAWVEALPVGNGRLGAMVFGTLGRERLQLNEDTLWSGGPRDWNNPEAAAVLPEIRRLIAEGRYVEADAAAKRMMGPYTQSAPPPVSPRCCSRVTAETSTCCRRSPQPGPRVG